MSMTKNFTRIDWLKMFATFLLPLMLTFVPTSEIFTHEIKMFMIITLWGILMFVFEQVPNIVAALLMVLSYIIFKVAPIDIVMKPWTMDITWVAIGAIFLVAIVMDTKFLERIGYTVLAKFGNSYMAIVFSVLVIAIIFRILMGATSAIAALAMVTYALCTACGWGRSKASAGIMLTGLIGFCDSDLFLYSPDFFAVLPVSVSTIIPEVASLNYPLYFMNNIIFVPMIFVEALIIGKMCGGSVKNVNRQVFVDLKNELPPTTKEEKKIAVVLIMLVIYLFTQQIHGQAMMYGFLLAPLILCFPGVNVGTTEHLLKANYSFLFFFTGCQAIGQVAGSVGIGGFINATLLPYLVGMSQPVFLILIYWFAFLLNFVMTPVAEMNAFGVPIAQIVTELGYGIHPAMYCFFNGVSNFILPYESAWPLFVYTLGLIPMRDWIKVYSMKAVLCFIWMITFGFMYWNFIGLM